jgi:ribosomal protein L37AE/L43A
MANELICSVCGQRIEPRTGLGGIALSGYLHMPPLDDGRAIAKGCWGKAIPKAPEPTGDDTDWYPEEGSNSRVLVAEPKAPDEHSGDNPQDCPVCKAPDVIEVEDRIARTVMCEVCGWYTDGVPHAELIEAKTALKAEIAANQKYRKYANELIAGIREHYDAATIRAERAEQERDEWQNRAETALKRVEELERRNAKI